MIKIIALFSTLIFLASFLFGADNLQIRYISADHVYLNNGTEAGLTEGSILVVIRDSIEIARIRVDYVSQHSASCQIISGDQPIQEGDEVTVISSPSEPGQTETNVSPTVPANMVQDVGQDNSAGTPIFSGINGNLSIGWNQFRDLGDGGYRYNYNTVRFRINGEGIYGSHLNLNIRARLRYFQREYAQSGRVSNKEWRNRVYTAAIEYDNPDSPFSFQAGRIISNMISGAGYVDGLFVEHRISSRWSLGFIGGYQPDKQTSGLSTNQPKGGLFVSYKLPESDSWNGQMSISGVGEYHSKIISREFLFVKSSLRFEDRFTFYQSLELDINRTWRKERTGSDVSLTGLYVNGSYKLSDFLTAQLTYDTRKNYYSYEYYTLADSLFDSASRQGSRLSFRINPGGGAYLSVYGGVRKRTGQSQYTYSYGGHGMLRRLPPWNLMLNGRVAYFSNLYSKGITGEIGMTKTFGNANDLSFSYGGYQYQLNSADSVQKNPWVKLDLLMQLPPALYLNGSTEYDFGDDTRGLHVFFELGYRF